MLRRVPFTALLITSSLLAAVPPNRTYENRLTAIANPRPILADYPEFITPLESRTHLEAPVLVDDKSADLHVRAWRYSYNARAIIEIPNHLRGDRTAVIVVHPWAIDDAWGWRTPEPAGVAFMCTPEKNRLTHGHMRKVLNPFLKSFRPRTALTMYSLPGREDPIRGRLYRSIRSGPPGEAQRTAAAEDLRKRLASFNYKGTTLPATLQLSSETPVVDYFKQLPGIAADPPYNPAGFWELPIPVATAIEVSPEDVVMYDGDGYPALRDYLKGRGIRHVLLAGYCTDMCVKATTAGYDNLARDFDVFLVGDATLAVFPAQDTPQHATTAALALAARDLLITQVSWIKTGEGSTRPAPAKTP